MLNDTSVASGHVEESETARKLQLYATSIKTSVSTRLVHLCKFPVYGYFITVTTQTSASDVVIMIGMLQAENGAFTLFVVKGES